MPAPRSRSDRPRRLRVALHAVDGFLDDRIEALHAEAGAVDAGLGERRHHLRRQRARVDLDGELGIGANIETVPDCRHQLAEPGRRHDGRRAAAEMEVDDRQALAEVPPDLCDLRPEHLAIGGDRLVALRVTAVLQPQYQHMRRQKGTWT